MFQAHLEPSNSPTGSSETKTRLRVVVHGAVQGVGFRPFVHRLAAEWKLEGWVANSPGGVLMEMEGLEQNLKMFLSDLRKKQPPRAFIQSLESSYLDPVGYKTFQIRESLTGQPSAIVMSDIATCPDCLREILDPKNHRYRYPFTNCTNCGPRFSIVEALPYDRAHTTMKKFEMCPSCRSEYEDPSDRRFHAEPNACPKCGPRIELWNPTGKVLASGDDALLVACTKIREGQIVAVKGLGGFHLMTDARSKEAVKVLRDRKGREEKPFALMYPNLDDVKKDCEVSQLEEQLLSSPEAPIVLLGRRGGIRETDLIAPGNPYLGIMLPYTPLHYLMMNELAFPVVATSGNLSEEPMVTDEREALGRLEKIADFFLVHNRPIFNHVDDSIVRIIGGREMVLRRARGYAPLPIGLDRTVSPMVAVGAHLKNTISISCGRNIFTSQHIGDLELEETYAAFEKIVHHFKLLYDLKPEAMACDLHPDYRSSVFAGQQDLKVIPVQHHVAHVLACAAENDLKPPFLGVAWDGTGYGMDKTIWGGEFFDVQTSSINRIGAFRPFFLPGSEQAIRQPRRAALGLVYEVLGEAVFDLEMGFVRSFSKSELDSLKDMLSRKVQTPLTTSVGRIFDAVSAIMDICYESKFEGQAAMALEFALDSAQTNDVYPFEIVEDGHVKFTIDWRPFVREILGDIKTQVAKKLISAKFHNTMVQIVISMAQKAGHDRVVLSGGCFQNKYLTERAIFGLKERRLSPYWHQRVPPNDGGISFGQIAAGSGVVVNDWRLKGERPLCV